MPVTRRRAVACLAAAAVALTFSACSSSDADRSTSVPGGPPEVSKLVVGIVPVIDHAAVFVAINRGFFTEEGLDVTARPAQGGAAAVPAMIAGEMQAAFATYPTFLLAQRGGVGIKIVAKGILGTEETAGVYVAANSAVTSISDLAGKTIAVNTLNNTGDLTIKTHLRAAGVEPKSVKFIELPFPDMAPTLKSGRVDAVWVVEPFLTGLAATGARKVLATYSGRTAAIPVAGIGMTAQFVAKNPNTAAAFQRAIGKANALLDKETDVARQIVPTYSQTTPEVAAKLNLPKWTAGPPAAPELAIWNDIMVDLGAIPKAVDIQAMVDLAASR